MESKPKVIQVIGLNAPGLEDLVLSKKALITNAKRVAAPKRILERFPVWWESQYLPNPQPELFPTEKLKDLIEWLKKEDHKETIILASGDPLWFGIGRLLLKTFPKSQFCFHPSPTSLQLAFAKLGVPWQDSSWISLHGRDPAPLANLLQKRPKSLAILTDPNRGGAKEVREFLRSSGLEKKYAFWVF